MMTETQLREVLDAYCRATGPKIYKLTLRHEASECYVACPKSVQVDFKTCDPAELKSFQTRGVTFPEACYQMAEFVRRQFRS